MIDYCVGGNLRQKPTSGVRKAYRHSPHGAIIWKENTKAFCLVQPWNNCLVKYVLSQKECQPTMID